MPPAIQTVPRLIVNADDFGLTAGVNRSIVELAHAGALSSATLMACGDAFRNAVEIPSPAGVGCHVVLVDGSPTAPPELVPTLLQDGKLRSSLVNFILHLQQGYIDEKQIEVEAVAQIQKLQSAGITVTHVDTHKHTHLFPRVARPIMRAARKCGVKAIRNPFEQSWSARLTRGALLRKLEVTALRNFSRSFHQLRRAADLSSTDGSIGVSATGHLDERALADLLNALPSGTWELVCHPGYNDADLDKVKTRLRTTRETERQALLRLIPQAVREGRLQLIGFRDL